MSEFFDSHVHLMNFDYVNFTPLLYSVLENVKSTLTSGFLSPSYMTAKNGKLTNNMANTLSRFQEPIKATIFSLEEDLKGHLGYKDAFIDENNKFHFRNNAYDKFALVPLCMDFSSKKNTKPYYTVPYRDKITYFAEHTLEQISLYKNENPNTIFNFYPFLGINTSVHSKEKIKSLLNRFFKGKDEERFYGVKLYPPLDFNPWPIENKTDFEKVDILYTFLEENNIPITTHCDNQGFRIIDTKTAWKYTDPLSYKYVLEAHPKLKIDFAHFGRFYTNSTKMLDKVMSEVFTHSALSHSEWMDTIINYIQKYDNVYTDLSFSLMDDTFVKALVTLLCKKDNQTEKLKKHILFGSDFSINLLKIDSYHSYLKIFETSNFDDDFVKDSTSANVKNFLFN